MPTCQGTTKKGNQCKRQVAKGKQYCVYHEHQAETEQKIPEPDSQESQVVEPVLKEPKSPASVAPSVASQTRQTDPAKIQERLKIRSLSDAFFERHRWLKQLIRFLVTMGALLPFIGLISDILGISSFILPYIRVEPMDSEFNVAIAEFIVMNEAGERVRSEDGRRLADFLYGRLQISFEDFDLSIPFELRPPAQTGRIDGATREEQAIAASGLAEEINANVVIYGVIYQDKSQPRFEPQFYVDYRGFEQAQEILGPHEFGQAIQIDLPFHSRVFSGIDNPPLHARSQALSLLTLGLAYHSTGNLQRALEFYQKAEAVEGLSDRDGKEVLLLLIGNAYIVLASQSRCDILQAGQYQALAADHYSQALGINPDYARALIGHAGVLYLQALGDPNLSTIDTALLDQSTALFERALAMSSQPTSANIPPKVNFGLGQIELVRLLQAGSKLDAAARRFQAVVNEYEAGNSALEELAGHTFARLGLIARLQGQTDVAVNHYERAIMILTNYSPYFKTDYRIRLGETFVDAGNAEMADDECVVARDHALDIGEPELVGLALSCLAESAQRADRTEQAEQLYRQAIDAVADQCPRDAVGYHADLARLYATGNQTEQVIAEYQTAIDLAYSPLLRARYYAELGNYQANIGNHDAAATAYDEAIRIAIEQGNQEDLLRYETLRAELTNQ